VTPPNATQAELRRPTIGWLPLSKVAAKTAMFGDWRWKRILYINALLPIAQADSVNQPDAFTSARTRKYKRKIALDFQVLGQI
jgi:hypothetical protein